MKTIAVVPGEIWRFLQICESKCMSEWCFCLLWFQRPRSNANFRKRIGESYLMLFGIKSANIARPGCVINIQSTILKYTTQIYCKLSFTMQTQIQVGIVFRLEYFVIHILKSVSDSSCSYLARLIGERWEWYIHISNFCKCSK